MSLAESNLREGTGINVIGAWFQDEFETPVRPTTVLEAGTVLLVTGHNGQITRLENLPNSTIREFDSGKTLILGHGEVGKAITRILDAEGEAYTVVDQEDKPNVDVVGEAHDTAALEAAGIDHAQSAILAIPDDTEAEYATLVMRDLTTNLDIAARTQGSGSVQKMYRAGANYVLSLAQVTGQMTASAVLEDETIGVTDAQIELRKTPAPALVGQTLAEARVREETDCTVVAVDRNGSVRTDVDADFRIEAGDDLIVAGPDEGVARFTSKMG